MFSILLSPDLDNYTLHSVHFPHTITNHRGKKRLAFYTLIILLFATTHIVDFNLCMYVKDILLEFPLEIQTLGHGRKVKGIFIIPYF